MDDEDTFQSSSGYSASEVISSANASTSDDEDTYYSGDYEDTHKFVQDVFKLNIYPSFETTLLGIARPILILMAALTNAFVIGFFFFINNRRRSSNLLFVSIAVSDSLTGLVLLPNSFYVYAGESAYLSKNWCLAFMVTKFFVSRAFHTVSVWQTVLLSFQRFLCVRYPFITRRLCTFWKTAVMILVIYIVAFVLHIYHALNDDRRAVNGKCGWFAEDPCNHTCIYLWATVILQHLLPSLILLVLTTVTLWSLYKASRQVSQMSLSASPGAITRSSRDRIVTIASILIVIVFLIPELPYGIYRLVYVIFLPDTFITNLEENHRIIAIYEVAMVLSFHVNFWIYCGTMSDFRQAVLDLLACGRRHNRLSSGKFSRSSSYRNGSARTNVSRTSSGTSRKRVLSNTTSILSTTSDFYIHPAGPFPEKRYRKEEMGKLPTVDDVFINPNDTTLDGNKNKIKNENSPGVDEMSRINQPNAPEKTSQTPIAGIQDTGDKRNEGKPGHETQVHDQIASENKCNEETSNKTEVSASSPAYLPMDGASKAKTRPTVFHR